MSYSDVCPCKGCSKRTTKCHGSCEEYKIFKDHCEKVRVNRANYYRDKYGWVSDDEYRRSLEN